MVEYIPIVHWVYLYSRIQETETCKLVSAKKELKTSRLQIWQIWVTLNFHVPQPKPSLNAWHSNLDHHRTIPDISSHWPTFSSKECPVGRANWELHQALAIQLLLVESWIMTLKSCDYEPEKKHTNGWCGAAKRKETTTEPQQELASALCLHGELCSLWCTFVEPELCERLKWFLCDAESAGAPSWELQWFPSIKKPVKQDAFPYQ